ncbi:MAG: hypothetical protein QXT67_04885 [Candidatus Bathyarchaeia archaeon]
MSHWSIIKIRIVNPNKELLTEAIKMVAKELNYTVDIIGDCAYLGFMSGVIVNLNDATIRYDDERVLAKELANRVEQLLIKYYTVLSFNTALRSLGYVVQNQRVGEKIVIRGIK